MLMSLMNFLPRTWPMPSGITAGYVVIGGTLAGLTTPTQNGREQNSLNVVGRSEDHRQSTARLAGTFNLVCLGDELVVTLASRCLSAESCFASFVVAFRDSSLFAGGLGNWPMATAGYVLPFV